MPIGCTGRKVTGSVGGQQLAHARQIGLADQDVGFQRQMRAVLFGRRQRQHRDPARGVSCWRCRASGSRSSRGAERLKSSSEAFLWMNLQGSLLGRSRGRSAPWIHPRDADPRPLPPIMGQNDRRSPTMNPAFLPRALTAGLLALLAALVAGARADPRQGVVRNQLGRGGRAWRLLPGGRRRHLQEIRPRRHHRARRPQHQQPHAADRRQARFLHEREHAAIVRRGRQQCAAGRGRRHLPEGSAGLPDPSGSRRSPSSRISSR